MLSCVTFELRHKHLPVRLAMREFTLDEPCAADLIAGLHADAATRIIIEYAALHRVPFSVVPCCTGNSMPFKPWMRHLAGLARERGFTQVDEVTLPMQGRARVIIGAFEAARETLNRARCAPLSCWVFALVLRLCASSAAVASNLRGFAQGECRESR